MKLLSTIIAVLIFSVSYSQEESKDSLYQFATDSLTTISNRLDSLDKEKNRLIDSLNNLSLSAERLERELDSIDGLFNEKCLALTKDLNNYVANIQNNYDSIAGNFKRADKLDSLGNLLDNRINDLNHQISNINNHPILENPKLEFKIDKVSKLDLQLPELNSPIPELEKINGINFETPSGEWIEGKQLLPKDIPDIKLGMDSYLRKVNRKFNDYNDLSKEINKDKLFNGIENKAKDEILEVEGVQGSKTLADRELKRLDEYKNKAGEYSDHEELKQRAINKGTGLANEKLKKNKEKVTKAQSMMSKYKRKFHSVQSIRDLPKKVPNRAKKLPFYQRIEVGAFIQNYIGQGYLMDFNPKLTFQLHQDRKIGFAYNQRFSINTKEPELKVIPIKGFSIFFTQKLYKRYFLYAEVERIGYKGELLDLSTISEKVFYNNGSIGLGRQVKYSDRFSGWVIGFYNIVANDYEPTLNRVQVKTTIDINFRTTRRQRVIKSWKLDKK